MSGASASKKSGAGALSKLQFGVEYDRECMQAAAPRGVTSKPRITRPHNSGLAVCGANGEITLSELTVQYSTRHQDE
jgi:hypothetical protein